MDGARKQRESLKENEDKRYTYSQNRKRHLTFHEHMMRNEEGRLVKCDTHGTYHRQKRQGEATSRVSEEVIRIDGI